MGNKNAIPGDKTEELKQFHKQILQVYETTFSVQKELKPEDLETLFPNRTEFCRRFINWMKKLSYKHTANRESFIFACEIMLLDSDLILKEEYKNHSYNFIEIFLHMTLAKYPDEIKSINQEDVTNFLRTFFSLFIDDTKDITLIIDVVGRMTDKLFTSDKEIHPDKFVKLFKDNLPTAISFGKRQVSHFLLNESIPSLITVKDGYLLNDQMLVLLGLTNNKILNQDKADLLYSSKSMGNSFHRLAVSLKGYDAPVIILIKNAFDLMGSPNNTSIFGVFANCLWNDSLSYFGNAENFLFKITPDFRTFYSFNGKGGKNYLYLNTKQIANSVYKSGLGIGGGINTKSRIWLDYDLLNKSYCEDDDMTFEKGILTQSPYDFLRIEQIEIWGFPNKDTEHKQQVFLQDEHDAIISGRKIDKKEMFNQASNEIIMPNQYKFKEGLNIDLDYQKEQLKKDQ